MQYFVITCSLQYFVQGCSLHPANSVFLSQQTSTSQQPASSTFLSQQIRACNGRTFSGLLMVDCVIAAVFLLFGAYLVPRGLL